ncbi:MAG: hypothetical protein WB502_00670 [Thermoactinomyces sp.]
MKFTMKTFLIPAEWADHSPQTGRTEEERLLPGNSLVIFNDYQVNFLPRQQTPATTQFRNNLTAFIQIINLFQIPAIKITRRFVPA